MDDLISRQMAIEVVQNRHIMLNKEKVLLINDLEKLPSAQLATDTNVGTKDGTNLAEVGTDCISKQQAIDALRGYLVEKRCPDDGTLTCRLIENEVINKLPSAEPKRGRWIKLDMHRGMADHKCTACEQECYVPTCMGEPMYAYCPNCGAKMEVNNEIN